MRQRLLQRNALLGHLQSMDSKVSYLLHIASLAQALSEDHTGAHDSDGYECCT